MKKSGIKRYTEEERGDLVQLYRQSGYSVYRFCKEMNLGYETLKRWLKEETPRYSLVEVTAAAAGPLDRPIELAVRLPNGLVCELGTTMSSEEALNWVRELKGC